MTLTPSRRSLRYSGSPRVGTRPDPDADVRDLAVVETLADVLGVPLLDWQRYLFRVALEVDEAGLWRYPDVGIAVSRQNGKTRALFLRIIVGLLVFGERVLHSAQNRDLPRDLFLEIAAVLENHFASEISDGPRRANGQESVTLRNGGSYRIVAPRQDAPRGRTADLIVLDEVREYRSVDFVSAILPALNTSPNPQVWYASNAGDPDSVVLNELRRRGVEGDPSLAWLEWSADPSLDSDDPVAWSQANPSLGDLIDERRIAHLHATLSPERFETEILCRWVRASGSRAIPAVLWDGAVDAELAGPVDGSAPAVAVVVDPERRGVAVAGAWVTAGGHVGTDLLFYSSDVSTAETEILDVVSRVSPSVVGFDPWTTQTLAEAIGKRFETRAVTGRDWVAACAQLLDLLDGDRLRHIDRAAMSTQLDHATAKILARGVWVFADKTPEPIPAVLATARAVWLASRPRPVPAVH